MTDKMEVHLSKTRYAYFAQLPVFVFLFFSKFWSNNAISGGIIDIHSPQFSICDPPLQFMHQKQPRYKLIEES